MALFRRGEIWWYEFQFARRRVRESAKSTSKTVAKQAEKNRRRELENGFNGIQDNREERVKSIKELATTYLEEYRLRHKSGVFAEYAIRHITRLAGESMAVDITDKTVKESRPRDCRKVQHPKASTKKWGFS